MNGDTQPLALVSKTQRVNFAELLNVAAAIQRQLDDDLFPEWTKHGSIMAWDNPNTIPKDYAPIFVCDTIPDPRLGGFHSTTNKMPYANVLYDDRYWSIDASHEALEIVLDPLGQTIQTGPSPDPAQGEVDFLVEICDPCGRDSYYYIDRVRVSDFYLTNYFDARHTPGTVYSKNNRLLTPFQVLPGGYLTWRDRTGQWWEQDNSGGMQPPFPINPPNIGGSLREQIDMTTAHKRLALSKTTSKQRPYITDKEAKSRKAAANRIKKHSAWLERQLKTLDSNQTLQTP